MVPVRCSRVIYVTMPQINTTVLQLTLLKAPLLVDGKSKCNDSAHAMLSIPRSNPKTKAPMATAMRPVKVTTRTMLTPVEGGDGTSAGVVVLPSAIDFELCPDVVE